MTPSIKRPVSVLVEHSESREFSNQQTLTFPDFERLAVRVAFSQAGRGYCKTRIIVTFDNGDTHQCRIDLGPADSLNFQDHIQQMVEWSATDKGKKYIADNDEQDLHEHVKAMQFETDGNLPALREALKQADQEAREASTRAQEEEQLRKEQEEAQQLAANIAQLQTDPGLNHLTQFNGQSSYKLTLTNIRADLKKHFPGVKFSVRLSGRLDMASVIWMDGPTENQVKEVTERYEYNAAWRWVFGKIGSLYISRDASDLLFAEALLQFNKRHGTTYTLEDAGTHQKQHQGYSLRCHVLTMASQIQKTPNGWQTLAEID